jgi:hydroxyethylthiazole kinase
MKENLWSAIESVRQASPLVHNVTNYVVMNNTANALLAVDASPIMAHAHGEIEEMVNIAGAVVINIGTLDEYWSQSMVAAATSAQAKNKPWVLDPVGAGASQMRNQLIKDLLQQKPTVIRGNASEIMAVASVGNVAAKGVDSMHQSGEAIESAIALSKLTGAVVCVSGATDVVVYGDEKYFLSNGDALMQKVTGLGCSATAIIGAFVATMPQKPLLAAVAGVSLLSVAGELARELSAGPGSLQMHILDILYNISEEEFNNTVKISDQYAG